MKWLVVAVLLLGVVAAGWWYGQDKWKAPADKGIPNLVATAFERNRVRMVGGRPTKGLIGVMLSDDAIEARADMVLAGLSPRGKR